ncbi:MAG TPA: hypothetical protein VMZ28_19255, partial [Kofleriaceae bacterium]|nr:hypothetical protein [Kofleriaceae bacterium]
MTRLLSIGVVLCCAGCDGGHEPAPVAIGDRCGECSAGTWDGADCVYPSQTIDLVEGLPPGDTGTRQVFHTESYTGTDIHKVQAASRDAAEVRGAVVIDRVYEVDESVRVDDGVLYTGGGIRRACGPHAVSTEAVPVGEACIPVDTVAGFSTGTYLVNTSPGYDGTLGTFEITVDADGQQICRTSNLDFAIPVGAHVTKVYDLVQLHTYSAGGVVFDSVLFDGSADCNPWVKDWRHNSTFAMRGPNTVRRSVFHDTPSTWCPA